MVVPTSFHLHKRPLLSMFMVFHFFEQNGRRKWGLVTIYHCSHVAILSSNTNESHCYRLFFWYLTLHAYWKAGRLNLKCLASLSFSMNWGFWIGNCETTEDETTFTGLQQCLRGLSFNNQPLLLIHAICYTFDASILCISLDSRLFY